MHAQNKEYNEWKTNVLSTVDHQPKSDVDRNLKLFFEKRLVQKRADHMNGLALSNESFAVSKRQNEHDVTGTANVEISDCSWNLFTSYSNLQG